MDYQIGLDHDLMFKANGKPCRDAEIEGWEATSNGVFRPDRILHLRCHWIASREHVTDD